MHFSLVREQLVAELGGEPDRVFAEFQRQAFAAASLGQVHRARLHTGEPVAVKIQYPGIARTIRADLATVRALMQPLRLTAAWDGLTALVGDLGRAVEREAEYRQEAVNQELARRVFANHPRIRVPRIHRDLSTSRLLVSDLAPGVHLDRLLEADPPPSLRDQVGARLYEVQLRLTLAARCFYPDANAGNFLAADDGTLTVLDFGNVRPLNDHEWELYLHLDAAMVSGDAGAMEEATLACATVPPDQVPEGVREHFRAVAGWSMEPFLVDREFDFGLEFWSRGMEVHRRSLATPFLQVMPVLGHFQRAILSGRALAARLGARFNAYRLHRAVRAEYAHQEVRHDA